LDYTTELSHDLYLTEGSWQDLVALPVTFEKTIEQIDKMVTLNREWNISAW
jgi:hypothetical protein